MQIAGVICEYNPFHTGHAWQLAEMRRRGAEAVVCCMGGSFTQRGDCAVVRKHARAEAALRGGADLVLELPLPWATASAEGFARGGAEVLRATGVVDTLAFGSECADTARILRVAEALASDVFAEALQSELVKGDSFAASRQRAVSSLIGADAEILSAPNDILGVEYAKALRGTALTLLALPRMGTAHDGGASGGYASASHIRAQLLRGDDAPCLTPEMRALYEAERTAGRAPVSMAALERAVLARLRSMDEAEFAACDEGGEGLYHRFYEAVHSAATLDGVLDAAKTKRYAYVRLRRMALSAFLGVTPDMRRESVPYIRVLGMNSRGKALLHEMRTAAALPVAVKPADACALSPAARRLMELEARATDLYALAYPDLSQSACGAEWRTNPVIL